MDFQTRGEDRAVGKQPFAAPGDVAGASNGWGLTRVGRSHRGELAAVSVSVIHESGLTTVALCAALMVLGTDRGIELARNIQIDVMFLEVDDSGKVVESSAGLFIRTQ